MQAGQPKRVNILEPRSAYAIVENEKAKRIKPALSNVQFFA